MRSFSYQRGRQSSKACHLEPGYTTGLGFLRTSKPTLPELTPETKGIAEGVRHSAVREHRNGDRGAWMGRVESRAEIRPLPGASPGVQDKLPGTLHRGGAWLREPLQAHQQSSEQHKHLALIRPAALWGCWTWGIPYLGFWASAQSPGRLATVGTGLQFANRAGSGIDHLVWCGGGGLNSRSVGIHFHSNQPLTANSQ